MFFLYQFASNLPVELIEIFRKPFAENLEAAMPTPEIPNPESSIANRLARHFGNDVTSGSPQELRPGSILPKDNLKLRPLSFSDPEPAVDHEPRRWQSLRRPLHLRDDLLRDRTRSLFIAREVH